MRGIASARDSFPGTAGSGVVVKGLTERQVGDGLRQFDALWSELFPAKQARIVHLLVERVDLSEKGADITLRTEGLTSLIQDLQVSAERNKDAA